MVKSKDKQEVEAPMHDETGPYSEDDLFGEEEEPEVVYNEAKPVPAPKPKPEPKKEESRYVPVHTPEILGIRDNKTGQVIPLKQKSSLEGEVGSAVAWAQLYNELWEIRKATGI
jgi:hypothetical protein